MSRFIKLVVTAVSALALATTAAPFASDLATFEAGTSAKQKSGGGWCC